MPTKKKPAKDTTKPRKPAQHPIDKAREVLAPYDRVVSDAIVWDSGIFGPSDIGQMRTLVLAAMKAAAEDPDQASEDQILNAGYLLGLAMGLRVADVFRQGGAR